MGKILGISDLRVSPAFPSLYPPPKVKNAYNPRTRKYLYDKLQENVVPVVKKTNNWRSCFAPNNKLNKSS
jgi:hypothetical protein